MAKIRSDSLVLRVHPSVGKQVRELADTHDWSISRTGETLLQLALDGSFGEPDDAIRAARAAGDGAEQS